ncbi:MAG: twin-arginine translocase subunit TatC [Verrucomicrobia bacterium]|nr:twin-arginine translocase subunit TatC [Verrucomicrobiota bacterium]
MAYYWVAPISIKAFIGLGEWLKSPPAVWTAESYYGFVPKLVLGMGLAFELPIVILTLVKLNIISAEFLVNGRRYMIMANLILSAFITPQDVISTIMLAAPLQILFEICILIARHWDKQEKRKLRDLGFDV